MNKLTLANLQTWVDEVSLVKVDLTTQSYDIISRIDSGIAGYCRTLVTKENISAALYTSNLTWNEGKVSKVEITFGYINKNKPIKFTKWFLPNDRI